MDHHGPPWNREENTFPNCQMPLNAHLLTQVGYDGKLQSGQDPNEDHEHADELS